MIRPRCDRELETSDQFCSGCETPIAEVKAAGQPMPEPKVPADSKCPQCGATLNEGDAFCMSCGAKIEKINSLTESAE